MKAHWLLILVPLLLAAALAVFIVSSSSTLSLAVVAGSAVMVVALFSTSASLYILIFSMLLGPEFIAGGLEGGTATAGRGLTLRFDDFLLLVIGFVWLAKAAVRKDVAQLTRTPLNRPIMFYIGACVFATLIGVAAGRVKPTNGFFYLLKYYEYVFIYFMVVHAVTTEKQARGLAVASLVVCFLVSLFAISQIPSGERASAPFEGETGEPNTLGGYLVFMLSITAGLLLTTGAVRRRIPLLILMGAGGVGLLATLSRSSMLAASVVSFVALAMVTYRRPLVFPVLLVGLLSFPWWAPEAVTHRVMETFTQSRQPGQVTLGGVRLDTSTSDRLRSWETAMYIFQDHPLWGTGITGGPFTDSFYPKVISETGLLGVAAFGTLVWSLFRVGLAAHKEVRDPFGRGVALGFLFGLLGLIVHSVGTNSFIIVRIMEPFWLYAALVVRSLMTERANQAAQVEPPIRPAVVERGRGRAGSPALSNPRLANLSKRR
jgi:O-antigen ligase